MMSFQHKVTLPSISQQLQIPELIAPFSSSLMLGRAVGINKCKYLTHIAKTIPLLRAAYEAWSASKLDFAA